MATTPTNLPVPSETPRDLKFNAGKIDEFVTSLVNTYADRFGKEHYTIEGLRWLAQQAIAEFGWIPVGTFQDGATLTLPNQILKDETDGEYYRWDGSFMPDGKVVHPDSTPSSSGGIGVGAWLSIGDAALRSDLTKSTGLSLIGEFEAVPDLYDQAGMTDTGLVSVRSFHTGLGIGGGYFRWYSSSTLDDNGFSIIKPTSVTGAGRWIAVKVGRMLPQECGCVPGADFDSGDYLNLWASQPHAVGDGETYYTSKTVYFAGGDVDWRGMTLVVNAPDINGVMYNGDVTGSFNLKNYHVLNSSATASTVAATANGVRIENVRYATVSHGSITGFKNAGIFLRNCEIWDAHHNFCQRNDWDATNTFASGGDIVAYTGETFRSRKGRVTDNVLVSNCSQNINVNSLSLDKDIIISGNHIDTLDADLNSVALADLVCRHGIVIGYNSNNAYGGGTIISSNIIRNKAWTGIYRSGGSDGTINYSPSKISGNQIYSVGLKIDSSNISGGILLGDLVEGDSITDNYVTNFGQSNSAAYRIQDTSGTGSLTMQNNIDRSSAGYGILLTGNVKNVVIKGHVSRAPAGANIFLLPMSGATAFGTIDIEGGVLQRTTDGAGVSIAAGLTETVSIQGVKMRGTSTINTNNVAVLIKSAANLINIEKNTIYGFAYGVWDDTYENTSISLPWGMNTFIGCAYPYRIARSTGSSVVKVRPNFASSYTSLFSNGGSGSSNGTEEFTVNGTAVT